MEKRPRSSKKKRASLIAGVLALAIALTGTLAWRNISQEAINEFKEIKNPGGRVHDDFKGTENKDIYAENFTDLKTGVPVFVRIKLREYMETGADAGINRFAADGATTNPDRAAKPLVAGADINDVTTWYLHKPDTETEKDPFHEYWKWDQDGATVFLPTFNKNKDSISPEVNGTYVGKDKDFETGDPYDDFVPYTDGQTVKATAYYDADNNTVDEYTTDPDKATKAPGSGGAVNVNYKTADETHTAKSTLNGLGYITMDKWKEAGMPICNKWVWDDDGWFYWPEPVMPETATGLLLDKVIQLKEGNEESYYAIDMVGEFASAGDWGDPDGDDDEALGFYHDTFSDDALALLNQAAKVEVGEDGSWYLPYEHNLYKQIKDDEGKFSDYISAGPDTTIGNADDIATGVLELTEDVVVGTEPDTVNYGKFFFKPTETRDCYMAAGPDGLLGTYDDVRLWVPEGGGEFPNGGVLETGAATDLTISQAEGATTMKAGETLTFTAQVMNGETPARSQEAVWTVEAADGDKMKAGTTVSVGEDGTATLTVDAEEMAAKLIVTATSKLDDRVKSTYEVRIVGAPNLRILTPSNVTSIPAGTKLQLSAKLYLGNSEAEPDEQPASITWELVKDEPTTRAADINELSVSRNGLLEVGRAITDKDVTVRATCTYDGETLTGELTLDITDPDAVTVTVTETNGYTQVGPGGTLVYKAALSNAEMLEDATVTWEAGSSPDGNATVIKPVTGVTIDENTGVLEIASSYDLNEPGKSNLIYIKATANAASANGASGYTTVEIVGPKSIKVEVVGGKQPKVKPGNTLQLKATVLDATGKPYANQKVTWSVAMSTNGQTMQTGTKITTGGLLTLDAKETENNVLTVTATFPGDTSVKGYQDITVDDGKLRIGLDTFVVLEEDTENHRALIASDTLITPPSHFGTIVKDQPFPAWGDENLTIQQVLDDWFNAAGREELRKAVLTTTLYTPVIDSLSGARLSYTETKDKVFTLSEADIFGTLSKNTAGMNSKDYTNGVGKLKCDPKLFISAWIEDGDRNVDDWWLRTPFLQDGTMYVGVCDYTGKLDWEIPGVTKTVTKATIYVRPCMYIDTNIIPVS